MMQSVENRKPPRMKLLEPNPMLPPGVRAKTDEEEQHRREIKRSKHPTVGSGNDKKLATLALALAEAESQLATYRHLCGLLANEFSPASI